MNILYLSYDGLTDPLGQSQILPYLSGLSKYHNITLVTFEKKNRLKNERQTVERQVTQSSIEWVPLEYHKSPPVLSTLYDLLRLWRTVIQLQSEHRFNLVHCRSYITSFVGLQLKLRWNLPFLFDMRGFWADERVEGGIWSLQNPIYKIIYHAFKRWEKKFIKNADAILVLTHAGKEEVLSWNLNSKVEVIPCCVDDTLFDPSKIDKRLRNKLLTDLGIAERDFVLTYAGSIGTWYLLPEMLNFYSVLRRQVSKSKFLIITPDNLDVATISWPDEVIVRAAKREEMPLYLSLSSGFVFFIKPSYSKKGSFPTKLAEVMAMNIPFVTNPGWGDAEELAVRTNGGLCIDEFKEAAYKRCVVELVEGSFPPSRPMALNYFSLQSGIQTYDEVYNWLVNRDN